MADPSQVQPYVLGGVGVFIAWRIYSRIRRLVGRQRYKSFRAWLAVVVFPLLMVSLLVGSVSHLERSLSELAGIVLGAALGAYGLRLTKFEPTLQGYFYTPNAHLGIALSLVTVGRLGYKVFRGYTASEGFTAPPSGLLRSPLTLFIVGVLAGYFATYAFGLIRWRRTAVVQVPIASGQPSGA